MSKKPERGKKASIHHLAREPLSPDHSAAFMEDIANGSDRAVALLVAAMVDRALAVLIHTRFIPIYKDELDAVFFSPNAPLGSFSSRTLVAFLMGLISVEERGNLDTLRRVRNAFAHAARPLDFSNDTLEREVMKLTIGAEPSEGTDPYTTRERFLAVALTLYTAINERAGKLLAERDEEDADDGSRKPA